MVVNPEKIQAIIIDRKSQNYNPQRLTINEKVITSENVTLLGLEVDSKINFDEHISKICNESSGQLNTLCRIGHLIGLEERNINKQLHLCKYPLVWHLSSKKSINKIENIQTRVKY